MSSRRHAQLMDSNVALIQNRGYFKRGLRYFSVILVLVLIGAVVDVTRGDEERLQKLEMGRQYHHKVSQSPGSTGGRLLISFLSSFASSSASTLKRKRPVSQLENCDEEDSATRSSKLARK